MATVSQLRSDLQGSRAHLFDLIRALSEEQFRHVPAGATWCIATHLAHVLRTERIFTERAQRALAEDEPHIASTRAGNDEDPGLAQRLAVPQIIHGMQAARRDLDDLLARCDDAALERPLHHERLGRLTIAALAAKMASHEREHAAEAAALIRQLPATGRVIIPLSRRS
jgi:uncharacterized damage-inducible protein DinB